MADMNSVLNAIAADSVISAWNPRVCTVPNFSLKESETAKCCVVPIGIKYQNLSRGNVQKTFVVDVGFIKRKKMLDVVSYVSDMEATAGHFASASYGNARCLSVVHQPLYDAEQLRSRNLFQSVMTLELKEVS